MATAERTPVAWTIPPNPGAGPCTDTEPVQLSDQSDRSHTPRTKLLMELARVREVAAASVERSFTEALREKYCFAPPEESRNGFILKMNIRGKPKDHTEGKAELGFLRNVVLCNNDITHAGLPEHGLRNLCPNVVDLDLSGNLITSWNDVIGLFCQLKQLKYANLAGNPLSTDQDALENETLELPALENLVLNGTGVSWPIVAEVCKRLHTIHELHICHNGYENISEEAIPHLSNIVCLRMNNNFIKSWNEIAKLSSLPKLKSLIISENPIENVFYERAFSQAQQPSNQNPSELLAESKSPSTPEDVENIKIANVPHESLVHTASAVCENIINEVFENVCQRVTLAGAEAELRTVASTHQQTVNQDQNKQPGSQCQVHQGEVTAEHQPHDQRQSASAAPGGAMVKVAGEDALSSLSESTDKHTACPANTDQNVDTAADQTSTIQQTLQSVAGHQSTQLHGEGQELSQSLPEKSGNLETQMSLSQSEERSSMGEKLTDGAGVVIAELQDSKIHVSEQADEASGGHHEQLQEAEECKAEVKDHPFAELESLCVSNTNISSFDDLMALSQFPKLHSVRIKSKTIFPGVSQEERRKMLISCLPHVSILNGSEVSPDERNRSEMDFLQQFKENPNPPVRFEELVAKHGKPFELRTIDLSAGFCEWADVTIVVNNAPIQNLKVHVVQPIGKFRSHLATKVLFVPRNSFRMYHLACGPYHNEPEPEVAFDELLLENLPLSRHNLMHEDEIHIEILDQYRRIKSVQGLLKQNSK